MSAGAVAAAPESEALDLVLTHERAVIGAALTTATAYEQCATIITAADFYRPEHETIWAAIAEVNASGDAEHKVAADHLLVATHLQERGLLAGVGGVVYLADCVRATVTTSNAVYYAKKVRDAAADRRMERTGLRLAQIGQSSPTEDERRAVATDAISELEAVLATGGVDQDGQPTEQRTGPMLAFIESGGVAGVPTGLKDLDEIITGLPLGCVSVIGARPGIGKTLAGCQVALNAARAGIGVAVFSYEMSPMQLDLRLLANVAGVNSDHLNPAKPAPDEDDYVKIAGVVSEFTALPINVWSGRYTPAELSAHLGAAQRKARREGRPEIRLVVIDYIGLIPSGRGFRSRQEEVAYVSNEIAGIAQRHNVAVLLLSQLNRGPEARADKKPTMSELRESGAIEQDAAIVILLHREDAHDPTSERAGEMDLIVAKNRFGESNKKAEVCCQLHFYRLSNLAPAHLRAVA